jgi:hypothetical protein
MTELWYYAEGEETRGPLSIVELVPLLAGVADPRRLMIWRHGFEDWKALEEVREVAQQVFRPPPIRHAPPPVPPVVPTPAVREPVVDAADAAHFKDVKPELTGIGGWLGLVAFGQVVGLLKLLVAVGQYYTTVDEQVWKRFPTALWGEAALNALGIWLAVYTTVLLFRHSRHFPRFFIWQMIGVIFLPLIDLLWVASMIAFAMNVPVSKYLSIEPKEGGQIVAGIIGAAIWIPYMLRSRRVANTFTV